MLRYTHTWSDLTFILSILSLPMSESLYVGISCFLLKMRRAWAIPSRQSKSYLQWLRCIRLFFIKKKCRWFYLPVGRNINLVDGFFVFTSFFFDMLFFPDYCFLSSLVIIAQKKKKLTTKPNREREREALLHSPHHQAQYRNGNTDHQTLPELHS